LNVLGPLGRLGGHPSVEGLPLGACLGHYGSYIYSPGSLACRRGLLSGLELEGWLGNARLGRPHCFRHGWGQFGGPSRERPYKAKRRLGLAG
jgi:hypothetical protein